MTGSPWPATEAAILAGLHPWLAARVREVIAAYPPAALAVGLPDPRVQLLAGRVVYPDEGSYRDHRALHLVVPALAVDLCPAHGDTPLWGRSHEVAELRWSVLGEVVLSAGLEWGGTWSPPRWIHCEIPRARRVWLLQDEAGLRRTGRLGRRTRAAVVALVGAGRLSAGGLALWESVAPRRKAPSEGAAASPQSDPRC